MSNWIPIEQIKDDEVFGRGTAFKFLPTIKGKEIGHYTPEEGLYYILSFIPGSCYMYLICLSEGKEGNALLCALRKNSEGYIGVTGKEIKRMLLDDIQRVLINKEPHYSVK